MSVASLASAETTLEFTGSVAPSMAQLSSPLPFTCRRVAGRPFMDMEASSSLPSTSTV